MVDWQSFDNSSSWDKFLLSHPNSTFLQSFQFGQFYASLGSKIWRLALLKNENIAGIALLAKIQSRLGSFLYCPGGPVLNSWENDFETLLDKIKVVGREEKVDFIRFDPRVLTKTEMEIIGKLGLKQASYFTQPECSQILDLSSSLEEIRKNFSASTRHNIGWVARKGIEVQISQRPEDFEIFGQLLVETSRRQKFHLHGQLDYYKNQFLAFLEKGMVKLFLAHEPKEDGTAVLAAAVVINFGNTVTYLHAASSSKNPKLRAPYLMQWKIIEDAKLLGFKKYDFWGVSPSENSKDPWAGVTAFKKSFGGEKIRYQKPYDLILSNKYYLVSWVAKIRKVMRGLV